jgi:putative SOS response-associated peptidase YedK
MCSRYAFVPDAAAWADYRAVFGALGEELLALAARPRLAPTDTVPIVVQQPGEPPRIIDARWGFIPHWWSKPELPRLSFNARSEEAATKPMWRDALRQSRCLIPATSWTEWQKMHGAKIPHSLQRADQLGFMFAGLWSLWRPRRDAQYAATCVVLTTAAAPHIANVHDRMPVVLAPQAWLAWLDPSATDAAAALELIRQHVVSELSAQKIA